MGQTVLAKERQRFRKKAEALDGVHRNVRHMGLPTIVRHFVDEIRSLREIEDDVSNVVIQDYSVEETEGINYDYTNGK